MIRPAPGNRRRHQPRAERLRLPDASVCGLSTLPVSNDVGQFTDNLCLDSNHKRHCLPSCCVNSSHRYSSLGLLSRSYDPSIDHYPHPLPHTTSYSHHYPSRTLCTLQKCHCSYTFCPYHLLYRYRKSMIRIRAARSKWQHRIRRYSLPSRRRNRY